LTEVKLEAGEKLLHTFVAGRANGKQNGMLHFTTSRAFYCPHATDRDREGGLFDARRRELIDVGSKRVEIPDSEASKKMCLRLVLVGEREAIFVVDDLVPDVEKLSKWVHPIE
jgi:hypothetical protein